jgi:hypothetical protein
MYAFGCNSNGQLGIGNTTDQATAIKIIPPGGCSFKDPLPTVNLTPGNTTLCASSLSSSGLVLHSGFVIASSLANSYKITWYQNGSSVSSGIGSSYLNYTATIPGTYVVAVAYVGSNSGCSTFPDAKDTMVLSVWPATFTAPNGSYCGNSGTVGVSSTAITNAIYTWYPTSAAATVLATTIASSTATVDVTNAIQGSGTDKIVYVKESGYASGMVMKKADGCNPTWNAQSVDANNSFESHFTTTEALTLKSITVAVDVISYQQSQTVSGTINMAVYGSKLDNNKKTIPDVASILGTFSVSPSVVIPSTNISDSYLSFVVPVSISLPSAGDYYIAQTSVNGLTGMSGNGKVQLATGSCTQSVPVIDNITGSIIKFVGVQTQYSANTGSTQGHFYDISFTTGQHYCDLVPETLKINCPCTAILATDLPFTLNASSISLCSGQTSVLTSKTIHPSKSGTSYDFLWYQGSVSGTLVKTTLNTSTATTTATASSDSYTVSATSPGLYTLLVRDHYSQAATACQYQASVTIAANAAPSYIITGGGTYCSISSAPVVNISLIGQQPFTLDWSNGSTTTTTSGITTGTYSITPTTSGTYTVTAINDANCHGSINSNNVVVTKIQQPDLIWDLTKDSTYCAGTNNTALTAKIVTSASPGSYSYLWYNTSTNTNQYTNNISLSTLTGTNTYALTVTDSAAGLACKQVLRNRIITQNTLPTYTITGGSTYCVGDAVSAVTICINAGIPPYIVTYKDGSGILHTVTATGSNPVCYNVPEKVAGTYQVTALTDASLKSCEAFIDGTKKTTIVINPLPTITVVSQTAFCATATSTNIALSGLFTFSPAGGSSSYTSSDVLAITTTNFTKSNISGVYTVSVTYTNIGCSSLNNNTITVYALPTVNAGTDASICVKSNINMLATVTGGKASYSYNWTPTTNISNGTINNPVFNSANAGVTSYTLSIVDANGCKGGNTVTLTANGLPTITANANPSIICIGTNSIITAGGGTSYNWSNAITTASQTVNPTASSTYIVTGTDANTCKNTATITVTENQLPTVVATASASPICFGGSTTIAASGANTYIWNPSTVGSISPSTTTTYYVTGTDVNNCNATASVLVTVNSLPAAPSVTSPITYYKNFPTFPLNSSVSSNNTLLWYSVATGGLSSSTAPTPVSSSIGTTSYYVSQIVSGCEGPRAKIDVTIIDLPVPGSIGKSQAICYAQVPLKIDQILAPSDITNVSYNWEYSDDSIVWNSISGATGASYQSGSLTASRWFRRIELDSNGLHLVNTDFEPPLTQTVPATTYGMVNSSKVTGWFTTESDNLIEVWGNNHNGIQAALGSQFAELNANLPSRLYQYVYLTQGEVLNWHFQHRGRCASPDVAEINIYSLDGSTKVLTLQTASTDDIAWKTYSGSEFLNIPTGMYQFSFEAITSGCGSLSMGNFLDDVNVSSSQVSNNIVKITVNPLPTVVATVSANPICIGKATTVAASGASSYVWNPLTVGTISPNTTTIFYVTGTDINNCIATSNVTVIVNPLPTIVATASPTSICLGSNSVLSTSGALTYSWDNGLGSGATKTVSPSINTNYTVTGIDLNACRNTATIAVIVNPLPSITANANPSIICKGSSSVVAALGGANYIWSNAITISNQTVNPLINTIYTVTATDANSCKNTASISIIVNALPTVIASASAGPICIGKSTTVTASGASSYSWNPSMVGTISPSITTNYYVTGTDINNCKATTMVTVIVNPLPIINTIATPSVLCIGKGSTISASGATGYVWDNSLGTGVSMIVSPTVTTTYTVTGTDVNSCVATAMINVSVNQLPTITVGANPSVICKGAGSLIMATGGTIYLWNNGTTTVNQTVSPAITTIYTVTGTDANSCSNTASTSVTVNEIPTVTVSVPTLNTSTGNYCISNAAGISISTTENPLGGTLSLTGTGVSGTTFIPKNVPSAGTYSISLHYTDLNGCKNSTSTNVTVYALPTVEWVSANPTIVCSDGALATIALTIAPTGGIGTFGTFAGLNSIGTNLATIDPVSAETGIKTITYNYIDPNGCVTTPANTSITIYATPIPNDININTLSTPIPGSYLFDVSGQALQNVRWYPAPKAALLATGNVFIPMVPHTNTIPDSLVDGCQNYLFTQTINGCESQPAKAKECVTSCPVKAPIACVIPKPCTAIVLSTTVCATAQGSGILVWFNNANTATGTHLGTGANYTVTVTAATNYTYYVAEYNTSNSCYGPSTPVTLTINPLPTVTAIASPSVLCTGFSSVITASGASSYAWNNNSLTANQTVNPTASNIQTTTGYSVTGIDGNGCMNTATVNVTVNPLPIIIANIPTAICIGLGSTINASGAGTGSYVWSNAITTASQTISPTVTTIYSVTGTDGNGCENTASTIITVNHIPTVNVSVPTIDSVNGNYCINAPALAITTQENPAGGTVSLSGTGVSGTNFIPSVATAGTYIISLNYTDPNGCKNSATTTATVYNVPTVVWVGTNPTLVCSDGSPVSLQVTTIPTAGLGTFGLLTGLTKSSETSASLDPVVALPGVKTVSYSFTDLHGCTTVPVNTSIIVYNTPEPKALSISTLSVPIPSPGGYLFDVTNQSLSNVTWYDNTKTTKLGTGMTYEPIVNHTNTTPDSLVAECEGYYYSQTINGCESQKIAVQECVTKCPALAPTPGIIPSPCAATVLNTPISATATAPGIGTIHWFDNADTKTATDLSTGNTFMVTSTNAGTICYYAAEYNVAKSCFGPATAVCMTINALPTITAVSNPAIVCTGFTSIVTGGGASSYVWNNNAISASQMVNPTAVVNQAVVNYSVTGTDGNGCKNTANTTVTVNPLPTITTSSPTAICLGFGSIIKASGAGAGSYIWSNAITNASQTVSPSMTTIYTVTGIDGNGCENTSMTTITVNGTPTVSVNVPAIDNTIGNYCVNAPALPITTQESPSGGIVSLSGIGVSGTNFAPSIATAGTYTISFSYTDLNGCKNSATTTATVYDVPSVIWAATNPTLVCSDGNQVSINVTTNPLAGVGRFGILDGLTKLSETNASLDPVLALPGVKTISYNFTDLHGCTMAPANTSIFVYDTPEPNPISINTLSTPIPIHYQFDVSGQSLTNVRWYPNQKTLVLGSGNSYAPVVSHTGGIPDSLVSGCQNYLFTQTINGCESNPVVAQECVINCPAKAPIPSVIAPLCTTAHLSTVLSATAQGSGALTWFDGSSTKSAIALATGTSYMVTVTDPSKYIYYVAEWDSIKACYGPTSPVILTINPLPSVSIKAPNTSLCYTSGIQSLTVNPTGGVLTGIGAKMPNLFDPTAGGKMDGAYTLLYTYTDANSCVNTTTITVNVTYADAPVAVVKQPYLINDIPPTGITAPEVCATAGLGSGSGIEWAGDTLFTSSIAGATTLCYDTKQKSVVTNQRYYIRQTENGCKSDAVPVLISITNCPWAAPKGFDVTKCENDSTLVSTSLSASTTETTPSWQWYRDAALTAAIPSATTDSYNSLGTTPGSTNYYVRFSRIEPNSGKACWSPATTVVRTVNQKPAPTIVPVALSVCYTSGIQTLTLSPTGGVLSGTGVVSPNQFDPSSGGKVDGTYTLLYTYTDANSCVNTTSTTINVTYANAPIAVVKQPYLISDITPTGTTPPEVCATAGTGSGTGIEWSGDSLFTASISGATTLCYDTKQKSVVTNQRYYIRQTENGCKSDAVSVLISITNCPWAAPKGTDVNKCENDTTLATSSLRATTTETSPSWQWYSDAALTTAIPTATTNSYNPLGTIPGSTTYYVRYNQVEPSSGKACWSPATSVTRIVNPKPAPTIIPSSISLCYTSGVQKFTLNPSGGILTGIGIVSPDLFDPTIGGKKDGTYTVIYTYTDANSCVNSTSATIMVTYADAPVAVISQPYLITDLAPTGTTVPEVCATSGSSTGIEWSGDSLFTASITGATTLCYDTKLTGIVTNQRYYVRQTENGCKSEAIPVLINIINCPWAAPKGFDVTKCENDGTLANSSLSATTTETTPSWQWFSNKNLNSPITSATTAVYNPLGTAPGSITYYVRFSQLEPKSGKACWSPATAVVRTVNSKPAPTIIPTSSSVCYDAGLQTVTLNPTGGVLSGTGVTLPNLFDPKAGGKNDGTYTLLYTYTDANNCVNTTSTTITVTYADEPVAVVKQPYLISDIQPLGSTLSEVCATAGTGSGTGIEWSADTLFTTTIIGAIALCYDTKLTDVVTNQRFYIRQTENGCKSDAIPVLINIINCPWTAPKGFDVNLCQNDGTIATSQLRASTIEATPSWQWYSDAVLTTPIQSATSNSYNPLGTIPESKTYYVRYKQLEPRSGKVCWSPATAVVRTVNPKPAPMIVGLAKDYCYNDGIINFNGKDTLGYEGTDRFIVNGISGGASIAIVNLPTDKVDTIQYVRTTNNGCKDSVTQLIVIHYVAPPVTKDFNYKVIDIGTKPSITAIPSPENNSLQWYNSGLIAIAGATGMVYTENGPDQMGAIPYYVHQTDTFGCVSKYDTAYIVYQPCRADVPAIGSPEMCIYDEVKPFVISRGTTSASEHLYTYWVYSPNAPTVGTQPVAKVTSSSSQFNPTPYLPSPLHQQSYQFWIAEFDSTDKCLGKAAEVLLTVHATQPPLAVSNIPFCQGTRSIESLSVINIDSAATLNWYAGTDPIAASGSYAGSLSHGNPTFTLLGVDTLVGGNYSYLVSQTSLGCQSSKITVSFVVNHKPTNPVLTPDSSCFGMPYTILKASINEINGSIKWYASANTLTPVLSTTSSYTPTALTAPLPGLIPFFATQSSNVGCTGSFEKVIYTLFNHPVTPVFLEQMLPMCATAISVPSFTVTNATEVIKWTNADSSSTGITFTPIKPDTGILSTIITAVQTAHGCVSDTAQAVLKLLPQPEVPKLSGNDTVCIYNKPTAFTAIATGNNVIKWYSSVSKVGGPDYLATGSVYQPVTYAKPATEGASDAINSYFVTQTLTDQALQCEGKIGNIKLIVKAKPKTPFFISDSIVLSCADLTGISPLNVLNGSNTTTFEWFNANTKAPVTKADGSVSGFNNFTFTPALGNLKPESTSHYYVYGIDDFGCKSDSVNGVYKIARDISKNPVFMSNNDPICFKEGIAKEYSIKMAGDVFKWYVNNVMVPGVDSSKFLFKPIQKGKDTIRLEQSIVFSYPHILNSISCEGPSYTFIQEIKSVPVVRIKGDSTICVNTLEVPYSIMPEDSTHTFTWSVSGNNVMYSPSKSQLYRQIDWSVAGFDTIYVSENNGVCTGYFDLPITVAPHAKLFFNWEIESGTRNVLFTNTTAQPIIEGYGKSETVNFNYFLWNYGREMDSLVKQSNESYLASPDSIMQAVYKFGYFDVTLISVTDYCIDTIKKNIFLDVHEALYIPNSFEPESKSIGLAVFQPKGFNLETYKIWIYDSWGNMIWYSDKLINGSPLEGWDGTYQGTIMKLDTYVWKVEASFKDGSQWEGQESSHSSKKKTFGNVLLLR